MNKKQYNNVIENTLKHEQSAQTEDSLLTYIQQYGSSITSG